MFEVTYVFQGRMTQGKILGVIIRGNECLRDLWGE